ncbi:MULTISPECIES: hypothetical protein [unclassified Microbacterium]|uniref:hypothetical protein n=1 Tax=unclassified Microbacterium TaxID=2609290 RepID=UPI0011156486|nr:MULTISPECIES: hypothetical protein [unclassified Microbacterium]MXS73684.1 hypothetical protein [Microbacterium sp. TL13]
MPDAPTSTPLVCPECGASYALARFAVKFCGRRCEARAKMATTNPALAAWLDSLTREFVAAVRIDPGYMIDMASEGAGMLARRGELPTRA